ncbi:hypothetical protein BDF14DRAFT_1770954 [Spinellus fusiger]|nr:hypothetical protein BDF14DRAFT_1770954 [Spinellus fusiger]
MAAHYSSSQIPTTTLEDTTMTATSTEDELMSSSPSKYRTLRRKANMDITPPLTQTISRSRSKFNPMPSTDASRFITIDSLPFRSLIKSKSRDLLSTQKEYNTGGSQRHLTVETAVFPDPPIFPTNEARRVTSQGDVKSLKSGTESIRSQKKKRRPIASNYITPTDIFAQNLSDAVLDVNDSDENEAFVYRDKSMQTSFYPPPWSTVDTDHASSFHGSSSLSLPHRFASTGDGEGDYYSKEKLSKDPLTRHLPRRPVLRSAVSELPSSGTHPFSLSLQKKPRYHRYESWYPSDEENRPLMNRNYGKKRRKQPTKSKSVVIVWSLFSCMAVVITLWLFLFLIASPLADVQVVGISNVLGTQKELIFNLQVRARNYNWWTVHISHASFSVFASSHVVPTATATHNASVELSTKVSDPAEFLGTIYQLEDPLVFDSGSLFYSTQSTAISQIQIKNPGETHGDSRGNERWSLLIRYPYELTVRGVLKYQILPSLGVTQLYSARLCDVSSIDPATGKISDVPLPERTICDDPSPVEGI